MATKQSNNSTALVRIGADDTAYPVLSPSGYAAMAQAAQEQGVEIGVKDLTLVTLASAGASSFAVKNDPARTKADTITGIVVFAATPRALFDSDYDPRAKEAAKPVCASDDGKTGQPRDPKSAFGGACAMCVMNQWGTARNGKGGKACSERRVLFVLEEGEAMPTRVSVPPTSIKHWDGYITRVIKAGLKTGRPYYHMVKTCIGAADGAFTFESVGELDDDGVARITAFRKQAMSSLNKAAAETAVNDDGVDFDAPVNPQEVPL